MNGTIYDSPEGLGLPNPADFNTGVTVMPMFTCQECGNEFPPKMSKGEIIDLTCKCGQSYNDELAKYGSAELLGL
jgi:hypothetical protein